MLRGEKATTQNINNNQNDDTDSDADVVTKKIMHIEVMSSTVKSHNDLGLVTLLSKIIISKYDKETKVLLSGMV